MFAQWKIAVSEKVQFRFLVGIFVEDVYTQEISLKADPSFVD